MEGISLSDGPKRAGFSFYLMMETETGTENILVFRILHLGI
jgi:hypothetical protein